MTTDDHRIDSAGTPTAADVAAWLRGFLAAGGGAAPVVAVRAAAKASGVAWRTVERAATRLGVVRRRSGFPATAVWSLPAADGEERGGTTGDAGAGAVSPVPDSVLTPGATPLRCCATCRHSKPMQGRPSFFCLLDEDPIPSHLVRGRGCWEPRVGSATPAASTTTTRRTVAPLSGAASHPVQ